MPMSISPMKMMSGAIHGKALPSRRGFLKIAAAAATVPALAGGVRAFAPRGKLYDWQLDVMGALSELAIWHDDRVVAGRTIREVRAEVDRLNGIFSLFRSDSEISRLDRKSHV